MPESITAQTISSPNAVKEARAASALIVRTDLLIKGSISKSGQMW